MVVDISLEDSINRLHRKNKTAKIHNFMRSCRTSSGEEPPAECTYLDISKVESSRSSTEPRETVKIFFRTMGSKRNNKPYVYPEKLPIGTAMLLSDDLYQVSTEATGGY